MAWHRRDTVINHRLEARIRLDKIPTQHPLKRSLELVTRIRTVAKRTVDAITVPEPWIALAEKEQCKLICEAFCVGSEVASPDIKPETYAAINRAISKAVKLINRNKKKYLGYFIADVPRSISFLRLSDFNLSRLRYVDSVERSQECGSA